MTEKLSGDQATAVLARALCQIDGLVPDDTAPRQLVCGPYGEVLPNWEAYREKAEAVLAGRADDVRFEGVAKRKLDALIADGYRITGYSIARDNSRGFIDTFGFVGWWHP